MDISGAEIRCISYLSNDQYMLDCYAKKLDPYMNLAAQLDPEHDEKYHRSIRWKYKMILLGSIYGMGIKLMAGMTGLTLEDCTAKHAAMFERMTGIGKIIKEKGGFCESHNGLCDTILGDRMQMSQLYPSRYARLGINQTIQGFAACSLAEGFFNVNYQSYKHPDIYPKVRVWNTVHDSSQNYFDLKRLFDIGDYYKMTLRDYLYNKYNINYEFDTEVGDNYFDMCDYNSISPTKLELSGNWKSLKSTLEKCKRGGLGFEIESIKDKNNKKELDVKDGWWCGDFVPDINPYTWGSFANIRNNDHCRAGFDRDLSKYSIIINKVE